MFMSFVWWTPTLTCRCWLFCVSPQLRSALDRVSELEASNSHLSKRLEKMKANRNALLAQQWRSVLGRILLQRLWRSKSPDPTANRLCPDRDNQISSEHLWQRLISLCMRHPADGVNWGRGKVSSDGENFWKNLPPELKTNQNQNLKRQHPMCERRRKIDRSVMEAFKQSHL